MLYESCMGRYQAEYDALWDALVPLSSQAETIQGELVRAIGKLGSEYYRNGNMNWDRGFRMLTNYLFRHLPDPKVFDLDTVAQIKDDINSIRACSHPGYSPPWNSYGETPKEDPFDRITDRVVEWCAAYTEMRPHAANPKLGR